MWKDVIDYEGLYEVSDDGVVRNKKNGHIKATCLANGKHLSVCLSKHSVPTTHYVHKLVYEAFNGKAPEGTAIHHINEDKFDNRLSNLELMDFGEHSKLHQTGEHRVFHNSEKVYVFDKNTLLKVGEYDSYALAAEGLKANYATIRDDVIRHGIHAKKYYLDTQPVIRREKIFVFKNGECKYICDNMSEAAEFIGATREAVRVAMLKHRECKHYMCIRYEAGYQDIINAKLYNWEW